MVDLAFTGLGMLLIAAKDSLGGVSPGKALTGVRVVHQDSNLPIGIVTSLKRNWPVLIPIMPLVMAVQLLKGPRAGDGMAHTRVVWTKYAHLPVFNGSAPSESPFTTAAAINVPPPATTTQNPYEPPRF